MRDTRRFHRMIDLICDRHQLQTLATGWPFPPDDRMSDHCHDCRAKIWALSEPNGDCWARTFRDATPEQVLYHKAIHEAGHAVIGHTAGMNIESAYIEEDSDAPIGGRVRWRWRNPSPVDYLAMAWAGEQAALRFIMDAGLDTHANRIDVHNGARHDAVEARESADENGLPAAAGRDEATVRVCQHWPTIVAVADQLVIHRRMTGVQVRAVIDQTQLVYA